MKILLTGSLGHIGSKLIRTLPQKLNNLEITMVDNLSTQRYFSLFNLPDNATYSFIESSIKDLDWCHVIEKVEAVIHLAALTDAAGTANRPEDIYENNFDSTRLLADACLKNGIPILFPSSTSVYGSQSNLVDESCSDLLPQSPYAESKLNEEKYILDLCKVGLKAVICRLGTIYGVSPGMRFHTAVNKFCWQAVMRQPLSVWETALHQKRPYLGLEDCVNVMGWILEKHLFNGEVYNIVSNNFTVQEVINEIRKHISSLEINMVKHKIMNQLSYEVSSRKFCKTGFIFNDCLDDGIAKTIEILKNSNS